MHAFQMEYLHPRVRYRVNLSVILNLRISSILFNNNIGLVLICRVTCMNITTRIIKKENTCPVYNNFTMLFKHNCVGKCPCIQITLNKFTY